MENENLMICNHAYICRVKKEICEESIPHKESRACRLLKCSELGIEVKCIPYIKLNKNIIRIIRIKKGENCGSKSR